MDNIISAINDTTLLDKGNFGNICQGCKFSGDIVYCSNPPKLKCEITGDFHLFGDKCNCKNIISDLHHALKYFDAHMFIADERSNHTQKLIDACKYRIPKVPGNIRTAGLVHVGRCPGCNDAVNSDQTYCDKCGQRLLWDHKDKEKAIIMQLTDLTNLYNDSIKSNSNARQNLQNVINTINITDESSQSLKVAYDLAVKLLELNE